LRSWNESRDLALLWQIQFTPQSRTDQSSAVRAPLKRSCQFLTFRGVEGSDVSRGAAGRNARQPNDAQAARRPAKFLRENEELPVVTIKFRRFALSTEIQTSSGPTPVDPLIAHDQADPGARDLWIGQIDILPDQPRALAMCINQPSAHPIVPVE
jgi:hypothetical protein